MKKYIPCTHQTETVVVFLFLFFFCLCNQAMINYDAEIKKYKMKKWHILAFGSLGRTAVGQWWLDLHQPSSDTDEEPEKYWENQGDSQVKAALASPPLQPNGWLVCSILVLSFIQFNCFVYCICLLAPRLILRGYLTFATGVWRNSCTDRLTGRYLWTLERSVPAIQAEMTGGDWTDTFPI